MAAKALQCIGLGSTGVWPALARKLAPFEAGRRRVEGRVERLDFGPGIEGDDVDQVDRPAVEAGADGAGAVGDALHLFEVFRS